MADEDPLKKTEVKYLNYQNRIARPISSVYELKHFIEPETKRNLPNDFNETKQQVLNINAPLFIPKQISCSNTQTYTNQTNKNLCMLKLTKNNFIPKSMRENINKVCLNVDAHSNDPLKPVKANKKENKIDQKNKEKDENSNEPKKKSNLFLLLESKDNDKAAKTKEKINLIGNDKSDKTQSYKNKKKQKTLVEQKIEQINAKGKKWKEEEERQRGEELVNKERPGNYREKYTIKGITKEINEAKEYKQKLERTIKYDSIKKDLREFLNMLTKDNYELIKQDILDVIKDNVDYQIKFMEILFKKAISERLYVRLYAKLCKELDKELPQKNGPKETYGGIKRYKTSSIVRAKLLDECKEIFQIKKIENFTYYVREEDPEEKEYKIKNIVLGNIYFITELIRFKIISKKIFPVWINNLFDRYELSKISQKLKLINLQGIVIFTDQFGSLIHAQEKKLNPQEIKLYKESIDKIFQKLDKIKDDPSLPGYIYYSIINLIEKRKNNYQMSKFEEYMIAKSRKEVERELEDESQITQENINDKMKKGLIEYKDFIEEKGTSDEYPWEETTYLYDKKEKDLDDILEGYIEGCYDFIENQNNIKFAKNYIKEIIEYY